MKIVTLIVALIAINCHGMGSKLFCKIFPDKCPHPPEPVMYNLDVIHGSGSGKYLDRVVVDVHADKPGANQVFSGWSGDTDFIKDPKTPDAQVMMPAKNIRIQAEYEMGPTPPSDYLDPIDLTKFELHNIDRADLKKSVANKHMLSAKLYGHDKVSMGFDPIDWNPGNGSLIDEHFCVGWIEGQSFYSVMVDWSVANRGYTSKTRGLENLIPGSGGNGVSNGHLPPSGADFYVWLSSNDHKLRTTIMSAGKW